MNTGLHNRHQNLTANGTNTSYDYDVLRFIRNLVEQPKFVSGPVKPSQIKSKLSVGGQVFCFFLFPSAADNQAYHEWRNSLFEILPSRLE